MELLFSIFFVFSIYSYFIYPLILIILPKRKRFDDFVSDDALPTTTIIITAHNEEDKINEKLRNTLELDYPKDKLQILVASDSSTDRTNAIVLSFRDSGIDLIDVEDRKGKENAQLQAINAAKGEILVFSDAGTIIPPEAIKLMIAYFMDNRIGAVSSEDRFYTIDGTIEGEGAYVKYEMWLRSLESQVHSLVGLSGSFFAVRKVVCSNWDISVPSDFNTALNCIMAGKVAVTAPDVHGYYKNIQHPGREYARKYRTALRGFAAVAAKPLVLNPKRTGFFSFEVFSHKIMRWLVPVFLMGLFLSNILLLDGSFIYPAFFIAQLIFYLLAILGAVNSNLRNKPIIKIPFYFVQVNLALAHAIFAFASGKRITMWNPSKR